MKHVHHCQHCGGIWRHAYEGSGLDKHHVCPGCGDGPVHEEASEAKVQEAVEFTLATMLYNGKVVRA